jgi:purine-binding chemotaxis protein CheW
VSGGTAWDDLRAVLRETEEILNRGDLDSTRDPNNSLDERTRQLARPHINASADPDLARVLTFSLGTERYAWLANRVRTISRSGRLTPVPSAPAHYLGVISLRGQILSVMDLRVYLSLPNLPSTTDQADNSTSIIVIDGAGLEIGVLASEVSDVINVPLDSLTPALSAGLDPELIIGVTRDGLTILDAEALLKRERQRVESEIERA